MCIMSDSTLHGDATVEDNINEGRDIGDGSESRVFTKRMASEGIILLYEASKAAFSMMMRAI